MFTHSIKLKPQVTQPSAYRRWQWLYALNIGDRLLTISRSSLQIQNLYIILIYTCIDPIIKGRQLINWIWPLLTSDDVRSNDYLDVVKSNMMGECRPQHLPRGRANWGWGAGWWKWWLLLYNPDDYTLSDIYP